MKLHTPWKLKNRVETFDDPDGNGQAVRIYWIEDARKGTVISDEYGIDPRVLERIVTCVNACESIHERTPVEVEERKGSYD